MTENINNASNASQAFRIFSYVLQEKKDNNTEIFANLAENSAENKKNTSGITVSLNDFSRAYTSLGESTKSNIRLEDCIFDVDANFLEKMQKKSALKNNIFAEIESIKEISNNGEVYQSDLFESEISLNNGIKYSKKDDDLVKSALNFAKADIQAIETAYKDSKYATSTSANTPPYSSNGKLDLSETETYADINEDYENNNYIKDLNLSFFDKDEINAKEYASYILYADSNKDGLITKEEAQAIADMSDEDLQKEVKEIYKKEF